MRKIFVKLFLLSPVFFIFSVTLVSCDWLFGTGGEDTITHAETSYLFENKCGRTITLKFDRSYNVLNPNYNPEYSSYDDKYSFKYSSETHSVYNNNEVTIMVKGVDLGFTWSAGTNDHEVAVVVGTNTVLFNKRN